MSGRCVRRERSLVVSIGSINKLSNSRYARAYKWSHFFGFCVFFLNKVE